MTVNVSAVSRALKGAGFERSVSSKPGTIRGWSEWTAGYRCTSSWDKTSVTVEWRFSSFTRASEHRDVFLAERLGAMADALTAKGYKVEIKQAAFGDRLAVTK